MGTYPSTISWAGSYILSGQRRFAVRFERGGAGGLIIFALRQASCGYSHCCDHMGCIVSNVLISQNLPQRRDCFGNIFKGFPLSHVSLGGDLRMLIEYVIVQRKCCNMPRVFQVTLLITWSMALIYTLSRPYLRRPNVQSCNKQEICQEIRFRRKRKLVVCGSDHGSAYIFDVNLSGIPQKLNHGKGTS